MATLEQAFAGIEGVAVPDPIRAAARKNLEVWWYGRPFESYRAAIESLVERREFEELCDAFRQVVPFGTGGRRGAVGVGPNRINPWTVGTSIQGHVNWLAAQRPAGAAPLEVVIAYDVRRFVDTRGRFADVLSPVTELTSRDLAELAARVYAANEVVVHLLPRTTTYLLSTPELSFTIRELRAAGGINVSASHNPPDDNGVKVYDRFGGQLAPPFDEALLDVVNRVEEARVLRWEDAIETGLVRFLDPSLHRQYVETVAALAPPGKRKIGLLYTPLHGTGCVAEVLTAAGFTCRVHEPQATHDGAFPTVPGGVANPELPAAMSHALAAAGPEIDLVLGTDPDADRIGCEVRHSTFYHLNGNEIAALVLYAALHRPVPAGKRPLVVITEVTSRLVGRIARDMGAVVVDDLLVGFKYVADGLRRLETTGEWGSIRASEVVFVGAAEESHGVLVTDRIRDKDAAGGAVLLAWLAAEVADTGQTLVDVLERLWVEHGYVRNDQVSITYGGAVGQLRLAELLDRLRAERPSRIGSREVVASFDHRDETGRLGPFVSESDRAARNVLVYHLAAGARDDGARVILRPSGTEPKLKVYVEVQGVPGLDVDGREVVDAAAEELKAAVNTWLA